MIDTDETGQKKLDEIRREHKRDADALDDWEKHFFHVIRFFNYAQLSPKQKAAVGRTHDKLFKR